jgi:hypothetical protein
MTNRFLVDLVGMSFGLVAVIIGLAVRRSFTDDVMYYKHLSGMMKFFLYICGWMTLLAVIVGLDLALAHFTGRTPAEEAQHRRASRFMVCAVLLLVGMALLLVDWFD